MSEFINPRSSASLIASQSDHVKINGEAVKRLAQRLFDDFHKNDYNKYSVWHQNPLHPEAGESAVDWIFLVDCLNFSFWHDDGCAYSIDGQTGYWALCAAINRALAAGKPVTDVKWLSRVERNEFEEIFKTDNGKLIPLIEQRLGVVREAGRVLIDKFNGSFANCIKASNHKAIDLIKIIVENFTSFRDVAVYKQQPVSFYKRAQILVADIWACFDGQGLGRFDDIEQLTMFSDYRVPQTLVFFDVLEYSEQLKYLLRQHQELPNGSSFEVEIRGCAIHAVELIRQEMKSIAEKVKLKGGDANVDQINSIVIDYYLWNYRRDHAEKVDAVIPFHRTRSIYY